MNEDFVGKRAVITNELLMPGEKGYLVKNKVMIVGKPHTEYIIRLDVGGYIPVDKVDIEIIDNNK